MWLKCIIIEKSPFIQMMTITIYIWLYNNITIKEKKKYQHQQRTRTISATNALLYTNLMSIRVNKALLPHIPTFYLLFDCCLWTCRTNEAHNTSNTFCVIHFLLYTYLTYMAIMKKTKDLIYIIFCSCYVICLTMHTLYNIVLHAQ